MSFWDLYPLKLCVKCWRNLPLFYDYVYEAETLTRKISNKIVGVSNTSFTIPTGTPEISIWCHSDGAKAGRDLKHATIESRKNEDFLKKQ